MGKKLYVGNLPFSSTEEELKTTFTPHGNVVSAVVIKDRETNRSRGFGFVEMDSDTSATAAITALNGSSLGGRNLVVNEAREREHTGERKSYR